MAEQTPVKGEPKEIKDMIISYLIKNGGDAGNIAIMRALKLPSDEYWPIRNKLIDEGRITRGRGRGGKVLLVEESPTTEKKVETTLAEAQTKETKPPTNKYQTEAALYEPIAKELETNWTKENRYRESIVEITALQGRRDTGGIWSRPDITVVGMTTYLYLPTRYFDVTTFEIKKFDGLDVTTVYEALAHRRAATRAYAIFHVPDLKEPDPREQQMSVICDEAKKHGIGVIFVDDPEKFETWEEAVEPARIVPNPEDLNGFIALQLTEKTKAEIVEWFK